VDILTIDAPLGWPVAFGAAIGSHQRRESWPAASSRELRYRRTDLHVQELTGIWPLSVSTDRIGIVAFRAARLLALLRPGEAPIRDGSSGIIEVYPAAALQRWGLPFREYKRVEGLQTRRKILDKLGAIVRIELAGFEGAILDSDDALDAVFAGLVGIAKHEGLVEPIPKEGADAAAIEGWIWLPTGASLGAAVRRV
jgi:hypothetical protein